LTDVIGLGDDFPVVQQTVVKLRDNLLRATHPEKT
jgi:MarR family transcriptional regulator, organic hydroperoxide resistance regulator